VAPAAENVPVAQAVQLDALEPPLVDRNVPAAHVTHAFVAPR